MKDRIKVKARSEKITEQVAEAYKKNNMGNISERLAGRTRESLAVELAALNGSPDTKRVVELRAEISKLLNTSTEAKTFGITEDGVEWRVSDGSVAEEIVDAGKLAVNLAVETATRNVVNVAQGEIVGFSETGFPIYGDRKNLSFKKIPNTDDRGFPIENVIPEITKITETTERADNIVKTNFIEEISKRWDELDKDANKAQRTGFLFALKGSVLEMLIENNFDTAELVNELADELRLDQYERWDILDFVNKGLEESKFNENYNEGSYGEWSEYDLINYKMEDGETVVFGNQEVAIAEPEKDYFFRKFNPGATAFEMAAFQSARYAAGGWEDTTPKTSNINIENSNMNTIINNIKDLEKSIAFRVENGLLTEREGLEKFNAHVRKVAENNPELLKFLKDSELSTENIAAKEDFDIELVSEEIYKDNESLLDQARARVKEAIMSPMDRFHKYLEDNAKAHQIKMEEFSPAFKLAQQAKQEQEEEIIKESARILSVARDAEEREQENIRQERIISQMKTLAEEGYGVSELGMMARGAQQQLLVFGRQAEENPEFLERYDINLENLRISLEAIDRVKEIEERARTIAENEHLVFINARIMGAENMESPNSWEQAKEQIVLVSALRRALQIRNSVEVSDSVVYEESYKEAAQ